MKRNKKVIAIISPKGGVGKTVTTANLAVALANEFGKKVLAVDTNITTASLGLHLNILYPHVTIYDIIRKNFPISKTIYTYNEKLDVIPASISIEKRDKNFEKLEENIKKVTEHYDLLLKDLVDDYDFILLDSAPGFNVESIAALKIAGGVLVVTNPDYPSVVATTKTILYAKMMNVPTGGIILNKVTNEKYELTSEEIEKALKLKVIKKIPFDKKIPNSIAHKTPVVLFEPYCDASIAYKELAASLIGKTYSLNFLGKMKRFLRRINF